MKFFDRFTAFYQRLLPSPFTIAILLTAFIFFFALFTTCPADMGYGSYSLNLLTAWQGGLWQEGAGGLYFGFQMMLILVLGHVLALTPFFSKLIDRLLVYCTSTAKSAIIITASTIIVAFFNWGLGLIFGAIMARKIGEKFSRMKKPLNYGLIGACGYVGLMVWHGGISGSAPTKAAEAGNLASFYSENDAIVSALPEQVSIRQSVFSPMNITAFTLLLIILPLIMFWVAKRSNATVPNLNLPNKHKTKKNSQNFSGAEYLDNTRLLPSILAIVILFVAFYNAVILPDNFSLNFITPNYLNFILLGFGLLLHKNINKFSAAVNEAIKGASGILIQFPLYFGMMAMIKSSGLIEDFSQYFIVISSQQSLPIYTFFSAGLVNIFVPSGGGQWVVQGPIIIKAAQQLNVEFHKIIMALAYGDQLTNMLQPFWALPLLGITGLKARQILPYTLILFLLGAVIFIFTLLLF